MYWQYRECVSREALRHKSLILISRGKTFVSTLPSVHCFLQNYQYIEYGVYVNLSRKKRVITSLSATVQMWKVSVICRWKIPSLGSLIGWWIRCLKRLQNQIYLNRQLLALGMMTKKKMFKSPFCVINNGKHIKQIYCWYKCIQSI